ncbi:MGMT family protein [Candidatus Saccharibacteria bacterium]|nr:MGMT family protein [Candidatus Saccharibacteria bacterium]
MNEVESDNFRHKVECVVASIPFGRVMTYGQIAVLCGSPRAARIVGGIAHWGDGSLPWQRVVKADGSLAEGYPGGVSSHRYNLELEDVGFVGERVNMKDFSWKP